jgi:translation elongation factor EF-Tu-like GTPase
MEMLVGKINKAMYQLIKVLANIELFKGENMRQFPFYSKYRPVFCFEGAKTRISGSIDLIGDIESFEPGASNVVHITFLKGIIDDAFFKKGQPFTFSEGGKSELGKGEILKII